MPTLTETREKLDSLRYQAHQIYNEAGPELDFSKVKCVGGTTDEKIARFQALQLEMTDVGAEFDRLKLLDTQMKANERLYQMDNQPANRFPFEGDGGQGGQGLGGFKADSIRKLIDNSPEFKVLRERGKGTATIELPDFKTLITLSTVSPANQRLPLVNMRLEDRTVMDMLGQTQVNTPTVEWYEETTVTNAAAEVTEGNSKPEGALAWTLRNTAIRTIAVWIPVTRQALDDNDFLEGEIRNRLIFMVNRREETEVLVGDGSAPNLRGILNTSGIQTQAKGAEAVPTAILRGIGKVQGSAGSGFADPDGIVMHPNDFVDMMVLQTTDGNYLLQAVLQQSPQARLWGLPIRQTSAITEGTALVGAFALGGEVFRRMGITVMASTEHSTYFIENKIALLAESRIGLAVQIPTAFCTVTGI